MSENTQNQNPQQEQYSLNDDRRVKVLSPGALVAKRFFRNRLAVVGLSILVAMFVFSFIGGLVSPYGQDEQFFTYTQMSKEYVGVTRNDTMRFVVADGQDFGSIAHSCGPLPSVHNKNCWRSFFCGEVLSPSALTVLSEAENNLYIPDPE